MGELKVAVVMPVRNEGSFIESSLCAVSAQNWPTEKLEVIVADGRSTDGTREKLERMREDHSKLKIVDNPTAIVAPGLNRAIDQSNGDVVIRVDGHCEVAPDYVERCLEALERNGMGDGALVGVGGPIETIGETWVAGAISVAMSSIFGVGGSAFRVGSDRQKDVDTVAFPAYPKATLDAVGPFDEELVRNQDDEYNFRLRAMGGRVVLCPEIRSTYYSRSTLRSLWRQYFQYGFWKVRVMQKHPRQMQPRQFVPAVFVFALMASLVASFLLPVMWVAFGLVAGTYVVTNLAASIAVAVRRGISMLPLLPFVFSTLHISYGIGFLWGLVRFAGRWGDRTTLVNGERVMVGVTE